MSDPADESEKVRQAAGMKRRVLFLCTGNSCRSQMAEGWARHLHGDWLQAYSAGVECHGLNPLAVQVMAETGVDISWHHSKLIDAVAEEMDLVVTVCGSARERCPLFAGAARVIHRGFDDPPTLAGNLNDPEEKLDCYRRVRDEIRAFVAGLDRLIEEI